MARALLFDLDGTLADTAPSLIRMVNTMLREQNLPALPFAQARNLVSRGAVPLLQRGFRERHQSDAEKAELFARFLQVYRNSDHNESRLFIGLSELFDSYSRTPLWGIVTNKLTDMTEQLLTKLPLPSPPDCIVCGDTLDVKKPDPAPLLHAAQSMGVAVHECVYIGDDERDIIAGRAAGMPTLTAAWGYIPPGVDYLRWGADAVANHPSQLRAALQRIESGVSAGRSTK